MRLFVLASALLLSLPALAASPYGDPNTPRDPDARRLGEMVCAARIDGDMRPLLPFMDPAFRKVSTIAIGDYLWQSHPAEQPTSCTIDIVNGFDRTREVLVRITYRSKDSVWADIVNLLRTPDSWKITNVFYETGGNLKFRMFEGGFDSYFD